MRKIITVLLVIMLAWNSVSYADPPRTTKVRRGPFTKLGRGTANALTGWVEAFNTTRDGWKKHGFGGALYGAPAGIAKAGLRTIVGIFEIITSPFPGPNNYEPILEPEFVTKPFPIDDVEMDTDK